MRSSSGWRRAGMVLWGAALIWAVVLVGLHFRQGAQPKPHVLTVQELADGFAASTIAPVLHAPSGTPLDNVMPPTLMLNGIGGSGSLNAYTGDVTLVTFVNPACTGGCQGTVSVIRAALENLTGDRSHIAVLAVDVDGSRLSRGVLATWWRATGIGTPGALLTGPRRQLGAVLSAYGVNRAGSGADLRWTPAVYVLSPEGLGKRLFITSASNQAAQVSALERAIRLLLRGRG